MKALVFDLDGTLLNTIEDLKIAVNHAITKYGYNEISSDDAKSYIGNGIKNLVKRSLGNDLTYLEEAFEAFKEYYFYNCNNKTTVYDGIYDVIDYAKKNNYLLACVSNKNSYCLNFLVDYFFKDTFSVVIGDGDGFKKKPAPDVIIECAKRLNINVCDVIYIGDSDVDVKTVINSKCKGIFVDYGYRNKEELINSGANVILSSPLEIIKILGDENYGYRND